MKKGLDPFLKGQIEALEEGKSLYPTDKVYGIHAYEDEIWLLWDEPKPKHLGRIFESKEDLIAYLEGNRSKGKIITGGI